MTYDSPPDFGLFAGMGIVFIIVYLLFLAGTIALGIWITYTVIWRAVRRGLREYYNGPGR